MKTYGYYADAGMTTQRQHTTTTPETTTTTDHHYNRSSTTSGTSSGTSSTGARACARARAREDESRADYLHGQYVDCCEYYTQSFRRHIPANVQREIATRIRDGMSADVIRAAMDETQTAARPTWAYTMAILRRCDHEGIKTLGDWTASKQRFQNSRNPALNYQQREYTDDQFGPDFFVDLDQYAE